MGQTDKQFNAFLRMVIARMKDALAEPEQEKKEAALTAILDDLQRSLEE